MKYRGRYLQNQLESYHQKKCDQGYEKKGNSMWGSGKKFTLGKLFFLWWLPPLCQPCTRWGAGALVNPRHYQLTQSRLWTGTRAQSCMGAPQWRAKSPPQVFHGPSGHKRLWIVGGLITINEFFCPAYRLDRWSGRPFWRRAWGPSVSRVFVFEQVIVLPVPTVACEKNPSL